MSKQIEKNITIQKDEISLRDLILKAKGWWGFLLSKWAIIVGLGLLGGGLGLAYSFVKRPLYTATTTFVLETGEKGGMGQYAGIASMMGIDLGSGGGGIFQGDNILELYKSRTMLEKTLFSRVDSVSDQLLIERYIEMNKWRKGWEDKPDLKKLTFNHRPNETLDDKSKRLKDSVIGKIVEAVGKSYLNVVKPDKKLSIIKVDVKANDEIFAKRFNEELVKNVNDFYIQTKTKKSIDNVAILQRKTDSVRSVMNGAIYTAAVTADATPNLNPTRQVKRAAPMQRAQFSAETNKAVLSSLVQNLEMAKISLLKEAPLIQVVDYPVYPLKVDRLGLLKATVIGGIFFGLLAICLLVIRRAYKQVMA